MKQVIQALMEGEPLSPWKSLDCPLCCIWTFVTKTIHFTC